MKCANVIELERYYAHAPSALWKALTTPELHALWRAEGDVRPMVGHKFELDMGRWGKQACEVLAVEPERLLRYVFAAGTLDTIITWQLTPEGTGTRLRLRHEGFNLDTPMGRQALEGMSSGWPAVLERLVRALAIQPGHVGSMDRPDARD
jgi:uncharacterized protein YndB with AHSA1/START domain